MIIRLESIVSNSEIIKNYRTCRDKAQSMGKVFIFKNNKADAVLFSISEYEKLSEIIEYIEGLEFPVTLDELKARINESPLKNGFEKAATAPISE